MVYKKNIFVITICLFIFLSLLLFGCKRQKIDFYRESSVTKMLNEINPNQNTSVKKSSGYIIYKDNSYNSKSNGHKFGPDDVKFELPRK